MAMQQDIELGMRGHANFSGELSAVVRKEGWTDPDPETTRLVGERDSLLRTINQANNRLHKVKNTLAKRLCPFAIGSVLTRTLRNGRVERARVERVGAGYGWTIPTHPKVFVRVYGRRLLKSGRDGVELRLDRHHGWKPEKEEPHDIRSG